MKQLVVVLILIPSILAILSFSWNKEEASNPVVIELFTSQGCSSCPAADRLLSEWVDHENVIALSFHVSYWNYLGWKDPYSNYQYTDRQRTYVKKLKIGNAYTPQMVVNGTYEFVGSNKAALTSTISKVSIQKPSHTINIAHVQKGDDEITFNYTLKGDLTSHSLNIALVERHVKNEVPRGENRGKTLSHDNVVRRFITQSAIHNGSIKIDIPEELNLSNSAIVVFIQAKDSYKIDGATKINL